MIDRDYINRILFTLSFKNMSGYQLSKYITNPAGKISNGTLIPILNRLSSDGFIEFEWKGKKKIYSLTEKGLKYVQSLREIKDEIRKRFFVDSLDSNLLYFDFLANLDDAKILKKVLEDIGDELIDIIKIAFLLEKEKESAKIKELKNRIRSLIEVEA